MPNSKGLGCSRCFREYDDRITMIRKMIESGKTKIGDSTYCSLYQEEAKVIQVRKP